MVVAVVGVAAWLTVDACEQLAPLDFMTSAQTD